MWHSASLLAVVVALGCIHLAGPLQRRCPQLPAEFRGAGGSALGMSIPLTTRSKGVRIPRLRSDFNGLLESFRHDERVS